MPVTFTDRPLEPGNEIEQRRKTLSWTVVRPTSLSADIGAYIRACAFGGVSSGSSLTRLAYTSA
jgi:hypothetical protein